MAKKKKTKSIVAVYFLVIAVLCAVIYLLPKVNDSMTQTFLAENGTIQVSQEATGYIVRDEVVYIAGNSGSTDYNVAEGSRVRKTATVMKVSGDSSDSTPGYTDLVDNLGDKAVSTTEYKAGINGVVSYDIDGFEGRFRASEVSKIKYKDINGIKSRASNLKRESVVAGEPVYKVYDNSRWFMVIWTDKTGSKDYTKGSRVDIEFEDADVKATVYSIKKQDKRYRIILKSDRYYKKLASVRSADVKIITKEASGVILENESITEKDGAKGVYVKNTAGEYSFVPVNILLSNETDSVVSESYYYDADGKQVSTVELYDEVLRKP